VQISKEKAFVQFFTEIKEPKDEDDNA